MKLLQAEAGVNDGKAGLQSAAGLFSKAGIFDKRSEAFNIKELDPYLLFDTRTSMLGELESPTLDLDASKPDSLNVITATRSGVATYTDANGLIQTAPENTVRVDYVDGVPMMLIEPAATNFLISDSFYRAGNVVETLNIDAPDGSTDAVNLSNILAASGDRGRSEISPISPSTEYTGAVYVRGAAGEVIHVGAKRHLGGTFSGATTQAVVLTGEWQRVEGLTWTTAADNTDAVVIINNVSGVTTADSVDVWGPQIEEGPVSTSYIPTSGSPVTRNADNLVIDGAAFSDFYNATEGTFYAEVVPQDGINEFPYYFEFSDGATANRHHVYRNGTSGNTYSVNISGSTLFNTPIGSVTLDALNRISYSYKENDYLGSSNGATPAPETGAVPTGISQLLIGNSVAPTPRLMTGRIKRLIYWPTHSDSL